jgi:selenocysteine lyase/cysteine desulfurase
MDKRTFIKQLSFLPLATIPFIEQIHQLIQDHSAVSATELATNEDFWANIRSGYRLKPDYINLENGYYCFMPQEILEHYLHHVRHVNYEGSYYLRTVQFQNKNHIATRLADMAGCSADELIITRNTTESLDTIIGGLNWQAGDEAVIGEHDYYAMIAMFDQVSERFGVVNKKVSVPLHPTSDEEIVDLYASAITSSTRLMMICHMINITGHILPVKKICDMAHSMGVDVMVDGAHAFAHLNFKIPDLHCDYYGASLHKWLSTPIGAGILYARKDKIKNVWPLFAEPGKQLNDISRLNHTGTHPVHTDLAIGNAIDYHLAIGSDRKEARLRYLQRYWTDKVRNIDAIEINTPRDPTRSCAIANVGIRGMAPKEMADQLLKEHRIWTVAINGPGVFGCRITPNIYTSTKDLDTLVDALTKMCR